MPPKKSKKSKKNGNEDEWFPTTIAKAPAGILYNPILNQQPSVICQPHAPPAYAQSHEILGGIILGSGHHNLAQNLLRPQPLGVEVPPQAPMPSKPPASPISRLNESKCSKYLGVTFLATRDKFQTRIYKGNREYNLGLYNVSADAALAYDIAQRLMMEMMSIDGEDTEVHGTDSKLTERVQHLELRKLEELEKDSDLSSPSLDWLDDASTTDDIKLAVSSKDIEGFNFHTPQEFYTAREKEITERRLNSSTNPLEDASGTYPEVFVLKMRIRKDAIKVTKAVIVSNAGMTLDDDETKRNWNYNVDENTTTVKSPIAVPLIPDTDTYTNTTMYDNATFANPIMGEQTAGAAINQNAYAMKGIAMNAGAVHPVNPYGVAGAMNAGGYPPIGGMPQASYAQSYNPMMQYQGGMIPGGAVQPDTGYNTMYGHNGGSVSGNNVIGSHPLENASIEQIDQRIIMLRQQKYQLEMMLRGQVQPGGVAGTQF